MGKIVMPKNSALLNEIESVLKIYYDANSWLPNDEYKARLKTMIGDDQYSSSYTKKAQITSYFGFTIWEDIHNPQSKRKITASGKKMYEALIANDTTAIQEVLMTALETVKFGRDNYGCPESSSDIEPPSLYIRAILDIGYLTYREFAFLLWKLEDLGANYTDALTELKNLRTKGTISLGEEANKYADCKPIMILVRWGFLTEDTTTSGGKHIIIAPAVLEKYKSRLQNLKIYNVDMDCSDPNINGNLENKSDTNLLKDSDKGSNILYYGVPGTGKSYRIKQTYHPTIDNSERVVFHPDYTYSDFVGQILPETKKDDNGNDIISYPFTPGPFTRILKKASKEENKDKPFYLIIEEINRGNAPAIFGEIFQLLDRCDETDKANDPSVNIGESVYSINNADIAKEVYGNSEHPVKIPANLFILATMNTADQNVFTLDTAFKRRWIMKSIKNNINDCDHANNHICGRNVTWLKFATEINNRILEYGEGNLSSEDNRLGAYFVKANELNDSSVFAEKVLMYLWNDAFKYDREKVFKSQYKSLEQLIDGFEENAFDIFVDSFEFDNSKINNDEANNADTNDNDTDNAEISVSDYYEGKNQQMVELCQNLITDLSETIDDMIIGARANYIALRLPGNNRPKNVVEIHIKRDKISLHIKEPSNAEYRIGELLPDNYRWSLNYRIDFVDSDNLNQIVAILQDSFANMR